jgi:hypothetical protein
MGNRHPAAIRFQARRMADSLSTGSTARRYFPALGKIIVHTPPGHLEKHRRQQPRRLTAYEIRKLLADRQAPPRHFGYKGKNVLIGMRGGNIG